MKGCDHELTTFTNIIDLMCSSEMQMSIQTSHLNYSLLQYGTILTAHFHTFDSVHPDSARKGVDGEMRERIPGRRTGVADILFDTEEAARAAIGPACNGIHFPKTQFSAAPAELVSFCMYSEFGVVAPLPASQISAVVQRTWTFPAS